MIKKAATLAVLCLTSVTLASDKWLIIQNESVGQIKAGWTANDVAENFSEVDYRFADIDIGEGMTEPGLIIFPNTDNELIVSIQGEDKHLVKARTCRQKGQWATPDGLRVGSSMALVERMNEGSITILGWEWDYGGQMFSNNNGKYQGPHIWFRTPDRLDVEFLGDIEINSSLLPDKDQILIDCLDVNLQKMTPNN